ncbi:MAG: yecD [Labilithrix sp.]|nr:yecD [Labilithrix sp.]
MSVSSALLLIEFQNEWLHPEGKLHGLARAGMLDAAVARAREALEAARAASLPIVHAGLGFTRGYPELGSARRGLRAAIPRAGTFVNGTRASAFAEGFAPQGDELVVRGRTGASAFSGSNLDVLLRSQNIRHLYLAGFALHVCVQATAWAAQDLGYEVTVLEDWCSKTSFITWATA